MVGLAAYKNSSSKSLSEGNRRILSLALALLGNPPVLLIEELTGGMDPQMRHILWKLISDVIEKRNSSIFQSKSFERN